MSKVIPIIKHRAYMSDFDNVSIKPGDDGTFLHWQEPDTMLSTTNIYCPFGI